jgi:hypothetical protein
VVGGVFCFVLFGVCLTVQGLAPCEIYLPLIKFQSSPGESPCWTHEKNLRVLVKQLPEIGGPTPKFLGRQEDRLGMLLRTLWKERFTLGVFLVAPLRYAPYFRFDVRGNLLDGLFGNDFSISISFNQVTTL